MSRFLGLLFKGENQYNSRCLSSEQKPCKINILSSPNTTCKKLILLVVKKHSSQQAQIDYNTLEALEMSCFLLESSKKIEMAL